jgi:RecA/RadA recombinase
VVMTQITQKSDILRTIVHQTKIINIFGPSGSGKSTLAMSLLKSLHASNGYTEGKSFYIDTEKGFTTTRFKQIKVDQEVFTPEIKMLNSILATQPKNLGEQQKSIMEICNNKMFTSKTIQINAIVLDTASHLFRNRPEGETWTEYSTLFQGYYENHILPLRILQKRIGCYLIFVHQVTWNPTPIVIDTNTNKDSNDENEEGQQPIAKLHTHEVLDGKNKPYLENIFQEIKPALWVELDGNDRQFDPNASFMMHVSDRPDSPNTKGGRKYKLHTEGLKFF